MDNTSCRNLNAAKNLDEIEFFTYLLKIVTAGRSGAGMNWMKAAAKKTPSSKGVKKTTKIRRIEMT